MIECDHKWNSGQEIRFCLQCRQVRTFPKNGEGEPRVVWQGSDDKRDPLTLPPEDKKELARLGQLLGVKKAADCIGIPMKILRAWCGSYRRQPKQATTQAALQSEAQSATHDASHDTHQSPKSPLSTNVVKSDLKVDLPPFPPFNDKWEAQVQSEWMVTYLELAKLKEPTKSTNC